MKFIKKSLIRITLACVLLLSITVFTLPVGAVDHSTHYSINPFVGWNGHESHVEWWYSQMGSKNFIGEISYACNSWNNTPTVINMVRVYSKSGSVLRIYSNNWGDNGWYGQHIPYIGYGNINLNEYYSLSYTQWAEVASHEMGHAHGLFHYNCASELMKASGFIGTPNPYTGDIAGINAKY
ncbi:MAG: hypothetical protein JW967_00825 [Dehalococcoidales bacterium]|nr:hypothetical protein [Dehalococcoidales bacterium]